MSMSVDVRVLRTLHLSAPVVRTCCARERPLSGWNFRVYASWTLGTLSTQYRVQTKPHKTSRVTARTFGLLILSANGLAVGFAVGGMGGGFVNVGGCMWCVH